MVGSAYLLIQNGVTNYHRCKNNANINKKINLISNKKIALNSHFICVY
nr:MAG TPA: hypothetical protein [Caudoviricetes sp.]DAN19257.1 MAG TPA: hypothetical protein [Caudoviricetes sp.]DAR13870.1 MAG TPA: hypothetical protein [Caudoviricetes sp.]